MSVIVFVDRDLGTGVNEKRDAGDPSLQWNKSALFVEMHVYIYSYKAALGSKKKKKKEQKQSQANNHLQRAINHSISWVRGAQLNRLHLSKVTEGSHWRESLKGIQYAILFFCVPFLKDSLFLINCCRNEQSCTQFLGLRSWERAPAWSLQWLPPVTSLKRDLLSYADMQCFLALRRWLFAWLCFCSVFFFFFTA